jgi:pantothenate kinase
VSTRVSATPCGESLVEPLLNAVDRSPDRFLLGITGPPGAGKSTLAAVVARRVSAEREPGFAAVLPMDGFHLSNSELDTLGLRSVKGAPETFDVDRFVRLLERVRRDSASTLLWPGFERESERTMPDAIKIASATRLVVIEGNYLLLDRSGWREVRPLLDEVWYVDAPRDVLRERLLARALAGGRTETESICKVDASDLRNADLVETTKSAADRRLSGV